MYGSSASTVTVALQLSVFLLWQLRVVLERKLERSFKLRHSVEAEQFPNGAPADRQGLG